MSHETLKLWAENRFKVALAASSFTGTPVQYVGVPFRLPTTKWFAFEVMSSPFPGKRMQLGGNGRAMIRYVGMIQIDCMQPEDTGELDVIRMQAWAGELFNSVSVRLDDGDAVRFSPPGLVHYGSGNGWTRKIAKIMYERDVFGS